MDENTKEKKNDREYNKAVLDSMTKLVEEKIDACKTGLPLILTIVTALIAFLFSSKYQSEIVFWFSIMALICLLLAFIALLLASFPSANYQGYESLLVERKKIKFFHPANLKSYQKISDERFIEALQQYLDTDLNEIEKLQADILKGKINEYRIKKHWLKVAYSVLIVGAALLIVIFYIGILTL